MKKLKIEKIIHEFSEEELLLQEAVELIKYFVKRVEEGSIKSKVTYKKYKDFLIKYENYLQI